MKESNISKGIFISSFIYSLILIIEGILQFITLRSSSNKMINIAGTVYYVRILLVQPLTLMVLIIFGCKALSIILKAAIILINKNEQS